MKVVKLTVDGSIPLKRLEYVALLTKWARHSATNRNREGDSRSPCRTPHPVGGLVVDYMLLSYYTTLFNPSTESLVKTPLT